MISKIVSTTRMIFVGLKYLTVGTVKTAKYLNSPELSEAAFALAKNVDASMAELVNASNNINTEIHISLKKMQFKEKIHQIELLFNKPVVKEIITRLSPEIITAFNAKVLNDINNGINDINEKYNLNVANISKLDDLYIGMIDEISFTHLTNEQIDEIFHYPDDLEAKHNQIRRAIHQLELASLSSEDKKQITEIFASEIMNFNTNEEHSS